MKIKKLFSIVLIAVMAFVMQGCFLTSLFSCVDDSGGGASNIEYIFHPPHSLHLRHTGQLFQSLNSTAPVTFSATTNLGSRPDLNFNWYLNNVRQTASNTNSFTLDAQFGAGEFVVRAVLQSNPSIEATKTIRVYQPFSMPLLVNNGSQTYDSTSFSASLSLNEHTANTLFVQNNPSIYIEWLKNGQVVLNGWANSLSSNYLHFDFEPDRAGIYNIGARVNNIDIGTKQIIFRGANIIENIGVCLNRYPQIYITWDNRDNTLFNVQFVRGGFNAGQTYSVSINAAYGGVVVDSVSVGGPFDIINDNRIVVTNIHNEIAACIFDKDVYSYYDFLAVPASRRSFVQDTYLLGNHFMTSDQDIYDILNYMIVFRPNQVRGAASDGARQHFNIAQTYVSSLTIYIGHNSNYSAMALINSIGNHISFTGRYFFGITSTIGNAAILRPGAIVTISIEFVDQLEPNMFGRYIDATDKVLASPFRNAGLSKIGWSGQTLSIDYAPLAHSIARTSDQLFFAVVNGFKPRTIAGSAAERIYNMAREALKQIVDKNMTKVQKLAAIYDFVMFKSSYDYAMLDPGLDTGEAVRHPAFYLEGVFETGFAVCDGMAKAFSLMAGMLGIESVRIIGPARYGLTGDFGQHAWNKVNVYGEWFIIDTTWGIPSFSVSGMDAKLMSQGWFMLNDFDVSGGRIEQGINNPVGSRHNANWFYGEGRFIHDSSCLGVQLDRAVRMIVGQAEEWARRGRSFYTVYTGELGSLYFAMEFELAPPLMDALTENSLNNPLRQRLIAALNNSNYLSSNNLRMLRGNNTVMIGLR